ncbi:DUF5671 domain-containing protein [Sulfitobacter aestuarii]|uniref:DUF5671 domain-containing protein n=1 Tax=Sulfitobacter aestuarii TaxID=2161676 RepID=A0ABW5TZZ8_9RHOB
MSKASNRQLSRFVRDALAHGRSRTEIASILAQAGWAESEVTQALEGWAETEFVPPVPRPQSIVSARDFFVYALTFGALLFAAGHLVALLHALIDHFFASPGDYLPEGAIRWSIAVLLVSVPLYLWLTLRDRAQLARDAGLSRSVIRKWLTYLTLLIAAALLLGDLVAVIHALLSGDLTTQFLAKAAVVALVTGGIFLFYRGDTRQGERR